MAKTIMLATVLTAIIAKMSTAEDNMQGIPTL